MNLSSEQKVGAESVVLEIFYEGAGVGGVASSSKELHGGVLKPPQTQLLMNDAGGCAWAFLAVPSSAPHPLQPTL